MFTLLASYALEAAALSPVVQQPQREASDEVKNEGENSPAHICLHDMDRTNFTDVMHTTDIYRIN